MIDAKSFIGTKSNLYFNLKIPDRPGRDYKRPVVNTKKEQNISNNKDFVEELDVFYSRFDIADYQQEHQILRDMLSECEKTIFLTVDQVRNVS